jgi:nucleotidyltransferase/DNA polymerase involved in DNA repair
LAKLASDHRKPNGQYVITPEMGPAFVETLPVGKFHGIGPATSAKMNSLGLYTGLDMRNQSLEFMQANFGKAGAYYYWISRGADNREVRANRIRKSVENTFFADTTEVEAMVAELQPLIDKVWRHCEDKAVNKHRRRTPGYVRANPLIEFVNLADNWGPDRRRLGPYPERISWCYIKALRSSELGPASVLIHTRTSPRTHRSRLGQAEKNSV